MNGERERVLKEEGFTPEFGDIWYREVGRDEAGITIWPDNLYSVTGNSNSWPKVQEIINRLIERGIIL